MRSSIRAIAVLAIAFILNAGVAKGGLLVGFTNGSDNTLTGVEETDFFHSEISATKDLTNAFGSGVAFARAGTGSLGVKVDGYRVHGAYAEISSLVQFSSNDPGITHTLVTISTTVSGDVFLAGNAANIESRLVLGSSPINFHEVFTGTSTPNQQFIYEHALLVPLNQPVIFTASIKTELHTTGNLFGVTDFSNSMSFNPDQFFELPAGVTANSVGSDWLVNNRLASSNSAVPEPASLALFSTGALALAGLGWRRRKARG